jgi:DNA-directed RNA polymerase subunit RPC12/RpoP
MRCSRCGGEVEAGEAREVQGRVLCEDCSLDVLNPVKACDPWAVHLARSDKGRGGVQLTPLQQQLFDLIKQHGDLSFPEAARRLGISEEEVRREFATLRHLELLRAHKPAGEVLITLFG